MPKGKSNLSRKTRNARRVAIKRKQLTPEQIDVVRTKVAAKQATKRSQETPEERAARCRRIAKERRQQRAVKRRSEKQTRLRAIISAIEDRNLPKLDGEYLDIAENQKSKKERVKMKKLQMKLKAQNTATVANTHFVDITNYNDSSTDEQNTIVMQHNSLNNSDSLTETFR